MRQSIPFARRMDRLFWNCLPGSPCIPALPTPSFDPALATHAAAPAPGVGEPSAGIRRQREFPSELLDRAPGPRSCLGGFVPARAFGRPKPSPGGCPMLWTSLHVGPPQRGMFDRPQGDAALGRSVPAPICGPAWLAVDVAGVDGGVSARLEQLAERPVVQVNAGRPSPAPALTPAPGAIASSGPWSLRPRQGSPPSGSPRRTPPSYSPVGLPPSYSPVVLPRRTPPIVVPAVALPAYEHLVEGPVGLRPTTNESGRRTIGSRTGLRARRGWAPCVAVSIALALLASPRAGLRRQSVNTSPSIHRSINTFSHSINAPRPLINAPSPSATFPSLATARGRLFLAFPPLSPLSSPFSRRTPPPRRWHWDKPAPANWRVLPCAVGGVANRESGPPATASPRHGNSTAANARIWIIGSGF